MYQRRAHDRRGHERRSLVYVAAIASRAVLQARSEIPELAVASSFMRHGSHNHISGSSMGAWSVGPVFPSRVSVVGAGSLSQLERQLVRAAEPGAFGGEDLDGLPGPVRRYLAKAIAPGAPLAVSARLSMRGQIKVGRWLRFRARQVLSPHDGFVWRARAAGVISGSDRYADGAGVLDWKLAGLVTVMHAEGPDVSRSAAGRAGAEALWVPTALLPRFGVVWSAEREDRLTARYQVGETPLEVHYHLDDDDRITSLVFDRWGDPDNTGTWGWHPFGGEVTGHRSFESVTVPSEGRLGWFFGTDRWPAGEFFRYRITDLHLVTGADR